MPNYAIFDPASTPANQVIQYLRSVPENLMANRTDAVLCPALPDVVTRCIVDGGAVRVMNVGELAVIAAQQSEQEVQGRVAMRPHQERSRRLAVAQRELNAASAQWETLDQAGINAAVKNLVLLMTR